MLGENFERVHGRYIDAIIRKRGNPQRWQSGSMANGSGRSQAESAPAEVSRRPALVDSTVAAIASTVQTMSSQNRGVLALAADQFLPL